MQAIQYLKEALEGHQVQSTTKNANDRLGSEHMDNNGFLIKKQIELKNGKVSKLNNQGDSTGGILGICYFILDCCVNIENAFVLIYIAIHVISANAIEMTMWYPIAILIVNIFQSAIVNFFVDLKLKAQCKLINKKEVQKFVISKKNLSFKTKTWDSLQPGDIIKIQEGEEFPADVLILDAVSSNNDHRCYVKGGFVDDQNIPQMKKACEGTYNKTGMRIAETQFISQISGVIKFEYNYSGFFSGNFMLTHNPAAFQIGIENVAIRGSYLFQTKAIICLVINVGQTSIGSLAQQNKRHIQSKKLGQYQWLQRLLQNENRYSSMRIFQGVIILIEILLAFIIIFQARFSLNSQQHKWLDIFTKLYSDKGAESQTTKFVKDILSFASGLFISLPLNYKIIMDCIIIFNQIFAEWDYNVVPSDLKFNN